MPRNLDPTLAGALSAGLIQPAVLVQLTLNSGVQYVWSGIGDLIWNGNTFSGVGHLGKVGPIGEGSAVKADGTTVTLSGIGLSQIGIPAGVTPPSPPFTPAAGESVAWSYATQGPGGGSFNNPPSIWNLMLGCSGSAGGDLHSGFVAMENGQPVFGQNSIGLEWSGFQTPPEIPLGSIITHVYPVVVVSTHTSNCDLECSFGTFGPSGGENAGPDLHTLSGQFIQASVANSVEGAASLGMSLSFVGMAVYYKGVPQTKTSLLYEALQDIRMGAPAKIWYALRSNGAFLGTPYLIFKGTVDKPTVKTSADTNEITIALENRLVNLQRPTARRYTAADQHLYYPDDSAFNWVEILSDMALVWG